MIKNSQQKCFEGDNINDLYLELIDNISKYPQYITSPRGMEIKEHIGAVMTLTNPKDCLITFKERKMNYAFAAIEKLEYLTGKTNPDRLCYYNSNYATYKNKYDFFDGAYPERLTYWYRHIYNLLKTDPDTRQAVMSVYGPQDRHDSKDIPCTLSLQFLIRDNKLNLIATMRSNDVLWGVPYDTNGFCFIQEAMAAMLGIEMGTYELHAGSLHIYTEREKELTNLLKYKEVSKDIVSPTIEKCTFNEMQKNLDMFWCLEYYLRVDAVDYTNSDEYISLPEWLQQYYNVLVQYVAKKNNDKN